MRTWPTVTDCTYPLDVLPSGQARPAESLPRICLHTGPRPPKISLDLSLHSVHSSSLAHSAFPIDENCGTWYRAGSVNPISPSVPPSEWAPIDRPELPSSTTATMDSSAKEQASSSEARRPLLRKSTTNRVKDQVDSSKYTEDGKRIITQDDCYHELGFSWSQSRKWLILGNIFLVQMSMNFNSAVITGAIPLISEKYMVNEQTARTAQMLMLVCYAFGYAPFLLSPFSGRSRRLMPAANHLASI